jgi:hypothetical protein
MLRSYLRKVLIEQPISSSHELIVISLVATLPAPHQQDRIPPRIECVEDPDRVHPPCSQNEVGEARQLAKHSINWRPCGHFWFTLCNGHILT